MTDAELGVLAALCDAADRYLQADPEPDDGSSHPPQEWFAAADALKEAVGQARVLLPVCYAAGRPWCCHPAAKRER